MKKKNITRENSMELQKIIKIRKNMNKKKVFGKSTINVIIKIGNRERIVVEISIKFIFEN